MLNVVIIALDSYGDDELSYSGSAIVATSFKDDTFLDILPRGKEKYVRILLKRGDMLWFRGDVAHRGVENNKDEHHYRIHCYCMMTGTRREVNKTYASGTNFAKIGRDFVRNCLHEFETS